MKVHLIGIGGIGVSALAQYYLSKGWEVSGSDLISSEITDYLRKKGVKIFIGNHPKNIKKDINLVIFSPAVKRDNPELIQAKKLKIKTISYPQALGELTKEYYTVAVAGAHGKSTTTAMISLILSFAGLDPTVIVGTKLKEFGNSNFRCGKSKILVIEACEYEASFLHYFPDIIVVTNIDREHLDYFKNFNNVLKTFKKFIMRLSEKGFLVLNKDDQGIKKLKISKKKIRFKTIFYSLKEKILASKIEKILKVPGLHNVSNALAAFKVAQIFQIPSKDIFFALSRFQGTWRRFEIKKVKIDNKRKILLINDYGHHPKEIKATLQAAKEKYPEKKIWCVFQPHQYQRTFYLFNDFVKVFRKSPVNFIILTDIYDVAGREKKNIKKKIDSEKLAKEVKKNNVIYLPQKKIKDYLIKNINRVDVLIIMGAGDIYKLENELKK